MRFFAQYRVPLLSTSLVIGLAAIAAFGQRANQPATSQSPVERGKYLVTFGGCFDCHTPGYFFGKPDMARYLGGSDVGFEIPGLGTFVAPNLTPDPETGLGKWTEAQIATALKTGRRPDGRELAPIMPWRSFAHLTKSDVLDHGVDRIEHRLRGAVAGVDRQIAEFERRVFATP